MKPLHTARPIQKPSLQLMSAPPPNDAPVAPGERAAAMLVRTPRALRVLSRVLAAYGVLTAVALFVAPWQQSIDGIGRVVAFTPFERQQEIDAPIEGRVTRWNVQEGSRVKQGELLLELTDNDPEILQRLQQERVAVVARKDAAVSRADSIRARQRSLESSRTAGIRGARGRVSMAQDRSRAAQQTVEAAEAARLTTQLNIERQRKLFEQGLTSERSVELAQLDAVRAATEVERALATLQAAKGEELALTADQGRVEHDLTAAIDDSRAAEASARAEEANAAAELARIEGRLARQSTMQVKSPMDGIVLRLLTGQGNTFVKAGDPLLVLVPDATDRAVELWVAGNDMPLVSVGRTVRLQFEGWPAVQFTGWPQVAVGTFGGTVALIDSADDGHGKFRVLVRPDQPEGWPSGAYLRQGVRVNGWVLLDQVTLGYELWRRFNGFPPSVKAPGSATRAK